MNTVGTPGQKSVQIGFKVNERLKERIDQERELHGGTLAEFLNEAVKHYIGYLENKRLELWKMQKEMAADVGSKAADDNPPTTDFTKEKGGGAGRPDGLC